jgi:flagellar hook-associated protein 2
MGLTLTTGIFTGLNTDEIIQKLMKIEQQPLQRLQTQKSSYEAKVSSLGSISSSLSSLKSALQDLKDADLIGMTATVSDTDVLEATASDNASEGTYHIVVNRLATAQSIYSTGFSSETDPVADLSVFTTQTLRIEVSGQSYDITVDSTNNTLSGIRDAINNSGAPVRASIINDGTSYRLVISSNETGTNGRLVIRVDEDNDGVFEETPDETDTTGLSRLAFNPTYDADGNVTGGIANMSQAQPGLDASLTVDGLAVTRSTNTIDDLITGVTLTLKDSSAGSTVYLTVQKDNSTVQSKLNSFVSAYNSAMDLMRSLSIPEEGESLPFAGDSSVRTIMQTLRSITTRQYGDLYLSRIGLTHDRNGTLGLDTENLNEVLEQDPEAVIEALNEMAQDLEDSLDYFINTMIPAREEGYQRTIDRIEQDIEDYQLRLEQIELSYRQKFALLEQTVGQLQAQGDYLTQQLEALKGLAGGKRNA